MSRKRPWYKRYPDLFIAGTASLTFEQKTTYSFLLDLIYANNGSIPDDPQWISRVLGCNSRRWNRLREELIAAGKLEKFGQTLGKFGESLRNVFANEEIESAKIKHLAGHKKKNMKREEESSLKARDSSSQREASLASPHERLATPRGRKRQSDLDNGLAAREEEARRWIAEHSMSAEARAAQIRQIKAPKGGTNGRQK